MLQRLLLLPPLLLSSASLSQESGQLTGRHLDWLPLNLIEGKRTDAPRWARPQMGVAIGATAASRASAGRPRRPRASGRPWRVLHSLGGVTAVPLTPVESGRHHALDPEVPESHSICRMRSIAAAFFARLDQTGSSPSLAALALQQHCCGAAITQNRAVYREEDRRLQFQPRKPKAVVQ